MSNQPPERIYLHMYPDGRIGDLPTTGRILATDLEYRLASTSAKERAELVAALRSILDLYTLSDDYVYEADASERESVKGARQLLARNSKGNA